MLNFYITIFMPVLVPSNSLGLGASSYYLIIIIEEELCIFYIDFIFELYNKMFINIVGFYKNKCMCVNMSMFVSVMTL